jgi:hypothetical protein
MKPPSAGATFPKFVIPVPRIDLKFRGRVLRLKRRSVRSAARATDAAPAARFLPVLPDHHSGDLASALTVISYSDVDHKLHRDFNTRRARAKMVRDILKSISGTAHRVPTQNRRTKDLPGTLFLNDRPGLQRSSRASR